MPTNKLVGRLDVSRKTFCFVWKMDNSQTLGLSKSKLWDTSGHANVKNISDECKPFCSLNGYCSSTLPVDRGWSIGTTTGNRNGTMISTRILPQIGKKNSAAAITLNEDGDEPEEIVGSTTLTVSAKMKPSLNFTSDTRSLRRARRIASRHRWPLKSWAGWMS